MSIGDLLSAPPAIVVPVRAHSVSIPRATAKMSSVEKPSGSPSATYASPASAPIAARSLSAPAIARWPTSSGPTASWSRRKCTPSTIASIDTACTARARTTAQSSPDHRTTRDDRLVSSRWKAAMRPSSLMAERTVLRPTSIRSAALEQDDSRRGLTARSLLAYPHQRLIMLDQNI